jgi:hypothetical protein
VGNGSSQHKQISRHLYIFTTFFVYLFTMKFVGTAAFALTVACAMGAKLSGSAALDDAKSQCGSGSISCCDSKEEISSDGILGGLLAGGLLNGLLGNSNSACASTSLIDELNLLGMLYVPDYWEGVIADVPNSPG